MNKKENSNTVYYAGSVHPSTVSHVGAVSPVKRGERGVRQTKGQDHEGVSQGQ